jgi:hypothetical protein
MVGNYFISGVFYLFNRRALKKYALLKLKQEINYNLRLVDMMQWTDVKDEFKLELSKSFKSVDMEYYLRYTSLEILNSITQQKVNITRDGNLAEIPFSSAINKMESLKILAGLERNILDENNRAKLSVRIQNIKDDLNTIKELLK